GGPAGAHPRPRPALGGGRPARRGGHPAAVRRQHPGRRTDGGDLRLTGNSSGAGAAGVRVSKLLAERGLCSRREADTYIEQGLVFVDGERVTQLGTRAAPDAEITLAKSAQRQQQGRIT